jgi:hypothetical protein
MATYTFYKNGRLSDLDMNFWNLDNNYLLKNKEYLT